MNRDTSTSAGVFEGYFFTAIFSAPRNVLCSVTDKKRRYKNECFICVLIDKVYKCIKQFIFSCCVFHLSESPRPRALNIDTASDRTSSVLSI